MDQLSSVNDNPVVEAPPIVMFLAVVPVPAETEAVGVPLFMFKTANFAEAEVVPPTNRSRVELPGYKAPRDEFHQDPPLAVGRIPDTSAVRETAENVGVVPP